MNSLIEKLKTENKQLKKTNELKSDLILISAHQLRTSISGLKWILKMFLDKDLGKLTKEQNDFIQKAYSNSENMATLVNDLLNLSHSENITIKYSFKKINLLNLIEQSLLDFSMEIKRKNIELIFLKPKKIIPLVNCDKKMIKIVLQNLIENAIKYINPTEKISISLKQEKNNVLISICDTGIGIKPKDKNNIFKKFFRTPNAVEKNNIGSGLGLFITKNIIEHHNGKIWFDNNQTKGTTFSFSLPIN